MSVRNFLAFLGLRNFFQRWFCSRPWALPFSSCWLCTSDKPVRSDFIFFLPKSLRDSVVSCSSLHRLFRGIMGGKMLQWRTSLQKKSFFVGVVTFLFRQFLTFRGSWDFCQISWFYLFYFNFFIIFFYYCKVDSLSRSEFLPVLGCSLWT